MFITTAATCEIWIICVVIKHHYYGEFGKQNVHAEYAALIPSDATVHYRIHSAVCRMN
jgi:hypothetical protein